MASNALSDKETGTTLARGYYQPWEQKQDAAATKNAYDYTKLARFVADDLNDPSWASSLLDKAAQVGGDLFVFAHIGLMASYLGDSDKAKTLYKRAVEVCQTVAQLKQLMGRLKSNAVDPNLIRELYAQAKSKQQTFLARLHWTEGIVPLFADQDWAIREYNELSAEFTADTDTARLSASRQSHIGRSLW